MAGCLAAVRPRLNLVNLQKTQGQQQGQLILGIDLVHVQDYCEELNNCIVELVSYVHAVAAATFARGSGDVR